MKRWWYLCGGTLETLQSRSHDVGRCGAFGDVKIQDAGFIPERQTDMSIRQLQIKPRRSRWFSRTTDGISHLFCPTPQNIPVEFLGYSTCRGSPYSQATGIKPFHIKHMHDISRRDTHLITVILQLIFRNIIIYQMRTKHELTLHVVHNNSPEPW